MNRLDGEVTRRYAGAYGEGDRDGNEGKNE